MKKTIPFKKDIILNTNIYEIVSISLDHDLKKDNNLITGVFTISGDYKLTEISVNVEPFKYELPFTVDMDERYGLDRAIIDIDDFYYEVINNNILSVNIEVVVDNIGEIEIKEDLELREEVEEKKEEIEPEVIEQRCIEEEDIIKLDNTDDTYRSYTVYIVREGDTIEQIIEKYQITKEVLIDYNDLTEIKIGDKIIIPC